MYQLRPRSARDTPEAVMNALKAAAEQRCPGSVWHVIREQDTDILYEAKIVNCPHHPDEVEVSRILFGHREMVHPAYADRGAELSTAQREKAIRLLMGARFGAPSDSRAAAQNSSPRLPGSGSGRRRGGGGGS
jgi:hypothetical protein